MTAVDKEKIAMAINVVSSESFDQEKQLDRSPTVASSATPTAKASFCEIENIRVIGLSDEERDIFFSFTPQMRKKLNRKIDRRIIPWMVLMFLFSNIDRGSIGNAKIEGIVEDLHLTGVQYNAALAVFFISYILFAIPSNILLKKCPRPSLYLGGLGLGFGIVSVLHGFVSNFSGLAACRFMLGIFETGTYSAGLYLYGLWYMPKDYAFRAGTIISFTSVSGSVSALLAAGVEKMDGLGGLSTWRWIFIVNGLITSVVGIASGTFMLNIPTGRERWLSEDELRFLQVAHKIKEGGGHADAKNSDMLSINWRRDLMAVLSNWLMWAWAVLGICLGVSGYGEYHPSQRFGLWHTFCFELCPLTDAFGSTGLKFSLPTITKSMGFSTTTAQLLSAPPYIFTLITSIIISDISDRMRKRAMCGYPILTNPISNPGALTSK